MTTYDTPFTRISARAFPMPAEGMHAVSGAIHKRAATAAPAIFRTICFIFVIPATRGSAGVLEK